MHGGEGRKRSAQVSGLSRCRVGSGGAAKVGVGGGGGGGGRILLDFCCCPCLTFIHTHFSHLCVSFSFPFMASFQLKVHSEKNTRQGKKLF